MTATAKSAQGALPMRDQKKMNTDEEGLQTLIAQVKSTVYSLENSLQKPQDNPELPEETSNLLDELPESVFSHDNGEDFVNELSAELSKIVMKRLHSIRKDVATTVKSTIGDVVRDFHAVQTYTLEIEKKSTNREFTMAEMMHLFGRQYETTMEGICAKDLETLRQELHHVVYAHNHNAEILKKLKSASDIAATAMAHHHPRSNAFAQFEEMIPLIERMIDAPEPDVAHKIDHLLQRCGILEDMLKARSDSGDDFMYREGVAIYDEPLEGDFYDSSWPDISSYNQHMSHDQMLASAGLMNQGDSKAKAYMKTSIPKGGGKPIDSDRKGNPKGKGKKRF